MLPRFATTTRGAMAAATAVVLVQMQLDTQGGMVMQHGMGVCQRSHRQPGQMCSRQ